MAELMEYKCPCCGGGINFDSTLQKMKCPYCETEFELDTLQEYYKDVQSDTGDDIKWDNQTNSDWDAGETDNLRTYGCQSCGAEIVADATLGSSKCPYCDNPIVMKAQFGGDLKPDIIIPFKLDKKAAKAKLTDHVSGRKLLPREFKSQNHIDEIKGVYVPFWLFDADADAKIRYKATKTKRWEDSQYKYVETSYYSVIREGDIGFDTIPVDGSSKMADDLMESVEPFDIKEAVPFQTAYLAGYLADRYDVTSDASVGRANQRVKKSTEDAFRATVKNFDTVITEQSNIRLSNGKVKYALYPVWMLNTTWKGNKYTFAMNGQTGKFVGNLPVDKSIAAKYFLGITGIVGALLTAVSYLMYIL